MARCAGRADLGGHVRNPAPHHQPRDAAAVGCMKSFPPPAGIFGARRKGEVRPPPPKKTSGLSPCTVIGVPACTVVSVWRTLVKNGLAAFLLADKYPRRRQESCWSL